MTHDNFLSLPTEEFDGTKTLSQVISNQKIQDENIIILFCEDKVWQSRIHLEILVISLTIKELTKQDQWPKKLFYGGPELYNRRNALFVVDLSYDWMVILTSNGSIQSNGLMKVLIQNYIYWPNVTGWYKHWKISSETNLISD